MDLFALFIAIMAFVFGLMSARYIRDIHRDIDRIKDRLNALEAPRRAH